MQYEELRSYFAKYHDFVSTTMKKLEVAEKKVEESDEREHNLQKQIDLKEKAIDLQRNEIKVFKSDLEDIRIKYAVQANDLQKSHKNSEELKEELENIQSKMGKIPELER